MISGIGFALLALICLILSRFYRGNILIKFFFVSLFGVVIAVWSIYARQYLNLSGKALVISNIVTTGLDVMIIVSYILLWIMDSRGDEK
jgi:hypothetical protein